MDHKDPSVEQSQVLLPAQQSVIDHVSALAGTPITLITSTAGQPILQVTGQFAGQVVRTELREIQKAEVGRKFAHKDRRPIDPPPVVQVRFFRVRDIGTDEQTEEEVTYSDVRPEGFVCNATLQPLDISDPSNPSTSTAEQSSTASNELFGSIFVQCVRITHEERPALGFVFSDLSVQREGTHFLNYRCFDIMGVPPGESRTTLAECIGGSFRIYPNRQFPGLPASTELTKSLVEQGVRSNNRRKPRTRRKTKPSAELDHYDVENADVVTIRESASNALSSSAQPSRDGSPE